MRKTVAVLVEEIWSVYTKGILQHIFDYFKNKNVNLVVSLVRLPNFNEDTFGLQYFSALRLLESKEVDSVIICSANFCSSISNKKFEELLDTVKTKKIISLGIPLSLKNSVSTQVSCDKAYDQFVKHLVKEHDAKRIAFVSAEIDKSSEALQRLEAYKKALKNNNLQYDENLVFYGRFVFEGAAEAFKDRLNCKEDVKFDSVFCANDMLAFGVIAYLEELGLKVPDDVRVIGYDDIEMAAANRIPLATINASLRNQSETVCQLAEMAANGKEIHNMVTDAVPVYRASCGCKSNGAGEKIPHPEYVNAILNHEVALNRVYVLLDSTEANLTVDRFMKKLPELLKWSGIPFLSVILYDDPVSYDVKESFMLPEKAKMVFFMDKDNNVEMPSCNIELNLLGRFWPDNFRGASASNLILEPIFYGDIQYGYIISKVEPGTLSFLAVWLKQVANEIAHAVEYTKKIEENSVLQERAHEMNVKSFTDELTGLMNRRGVMKYGRTLIDIAAKEDKGGYVLFCDMDHLKYINDTYGHEYGDEAIKIQSEALKKAFRSNDLICRLGGDEFVIIAAGFPESKIPMVNVRVSEICKELTKAKNLPFEVNISIGGVPFDKDHTDIEKLLQDADKEQYKVKKLHHENETGTAK